MNELLLELLNKYEPNDKYDLFWEFAYERQNIFKRKIDDDIELTIDPILITYKFTNVYRVNDRVTQYLVSKVINDKYNDQDLLFRILLFKIFNKIETWQSLESILGDINYVNYSFEKYTSALNQLKTSKQKIYSAAYIMPSGVTSFGYNQKHYNNLKLLELIMQDNPLSKIKLMTKLDDLYEYLIKFPTIGKFLAFQYSIDINYSRITDFSEMDFVVAGPGAIRGINKCFNNVKSADFNKIIELVTRLQEYEFSTRKLDFIFLDTRKLQLIDVQNIFCEFDKYTRVYFHQENSRIKQKYKKHKDKICYIYPEKWMINQKGKNNGNSET
ncbi:MAG: hypothetical protein KJ847_02975 [Firmicutes bacterium]|nr:hypothetical protein [Bacillota bacterium]